MSQTPKHYSSYLLGTLVVFFFDVWGLALQEKVQDSRPHVEMVAFTGNGVSLTWILSYRWAVALGKKKKENHTGLELRAILSWCLVRKPFHKQKPGPSDFFLIYKLDHEFVFNGFFLLLMFSLLNNSIIINSLWNFYVRNLDSPVPEMETQTPLGKCGWIVFGGWGWEMFDPKCLSV